MIFLYLFEALILKIMPTLPFTKFSTSFSSGTQFVVPSSCRFSLSSDDIVSILLWQDKSIYDFLLSQTTRRLSFVKLKLIDSSLLLLLPSSQLYSFLLDKCLLNTSYVKGTDFLLSPFKNS